MSSSPTIGDRLATAKAQRLHVSDIKDPMVRCLWWHQWQWQNEQIMADCRPMMSEFGHLFDAASDEVDIARKARAKILNDRWALRFRPADRSAA